MNKHKKLTLRSAFCFYIVLLTAKAMMAITMNNPELSSLNARLTVDFSIFNNIFRRNKIMTNTRNRINIYALLYTFFVIISLLLDLVNRYAKV